MKYATRSFALFLVWFALGASRADAAPPIVLVRGTVSTPNEAERNYGARLTRYFERRMADLGIACATIDDEDLATALTTARLAILTYNPAPPAPQLAALERFLEGGGKLMVFYSASPELAAMMRLRLGAYKAAPAGGQWSRMIFNTAAPPGMPEAVRQESRNIRPVYPASPAARTIAYWANGAGQATQEPAWVLSDRGAWMSHVLLNDGDDRRKQQMLLSLIATATPDALRHAAEKSMRDLCRFGALDGMPALAARVRRQLASRPRRTQRAIEALLRQAKAMHQRIPALREERRYADMISLGREIEQVMLEAFARAQSSRKNERRAVWEHSGLGLYPGDWEKTCRVLKAHGITDLFPNVVWPGATLYPSRLAPESDRLTLHGDQLAACIAAARRTGVRVHAWKVCWNLSKAPASFVEPLRRAGRLQVTDTGRVIPWLCPSNTDNLRLEKDMIREIVRDYAVDGIHLDYIRYPDSHSCYCATCRQHFEEHLGRGVPRWPDGVREAPLLERYRSWRAEQITRLVRDVRALLRAKDPRITLSVAVYGRYPLCIASIAQDWGQWMEEDLVDFVCPMNYTEETARFDALVAMQAALPAADGRLLPGIGVTANESHLNAVQVIDQITTLREHGVPGFVLFALNRMTEEDILPYLRMGITADP